MKAIPIVLVHGVGQTQPRELLRASAKIARLLPAATSRQEVCWNRYVDQPFHSIIDAPSRHFSNVGLCKIRFIRRILVKVIRSWRNTFPLRLLNTALFIKTALNVRSALNLSRSRNWYSITDGKASQPKAVFAGVDATFSLTYFLLFFSPFVALFASIWLFVGERLGYPLPGFWTDWWNFRRVGLVILMTFSCAVIIEAFCVSVGLFVKCGKGFLESIFGMVATATLRTGSGLFVLFIAYAIPVTALRWTWNLYIAETSAVLNRSFGGRRTFMSRALLLGGVLTAYVAPVAVGILCLSKLGFWPWSLLFLCGGLMLYSVAGGIAKTFADIFNYIGDCNYRQGIQREVSAAMDKVFSQHQIVVIAAHSLGSVIMLDYLWNSAHAWSRKNVILVTAGSPLRRFFFRFFPDIFFPADAATCAFGLRTRFRRFGWHNVCRLLDYVGQRIELPNVSWCSERRFNVLFPWHTSYWSSNRVARWLCCATRRVTTKRLTGPVESLELDVRCKPASGHGGIHDEDAGLRWAFLLYIAFALIVIFSSYSNKKELNALLEQSHHSETPAQLHRELEFHVIDKIPQWIPRLTCEVGGKQFQTQEEFTGAEGWVYVDRDAVHKSASERGLGNEYSMSVTLLSRGGASGFFVVKEFPPSVSWFNRALVLCTIGVLFFSLLAQAFAWVFRGFREFTTVFTRSSPLEIVRKSELHGR